MSSTTKIYLALRQWIELIKHPLYEMQEDASNIQRRLKLVSKDASLIPKELLDRNIWGGMGSFIDCAGLNTFAAPPKGNDSKVREDHWQKIHAEENEWKHSFNTATIMLGSAILDWCTENKVELQPWQSEMINRWVKFAKLSNAEPFEHLKPEDILVLEHNFRCHEAQN